MSNKQSLSNRAAILFRKPSSLSICLDYAKNNQLDVIDELRSVGDFLDRIKFIWRESIDNFIFSDVNDFFDFCHNSPLDVFQRPLAFHVVNTSHGGEPIIFRNDDKLEDILKLFENESQRLVLAVVNIHFDPIRYDSGPSRSQRKQSSAAMPSPPPEDMDMDMAISPRESFHQLLPKMSNIASSPMQSQPSATMAGSRNEVPLRSSSEPLPHDGLFVRRNNSYGTKSVLGIKDMIENGVIIDQTNIRFDDFIASETEQILSPGPNQALAVSHGVASIQPTYRYHERTTHYLEIALKASATGSKILPEENKRAVNYIFVVDVSGSMEGEKLDTVKAAIREIYKQMHKDDIIGIVVFDDHVKTLLKATPKREIDVSKFGEVVAEFRVGGTTDINLGLSYGIDELSRYSKSGLVNNLYLFTDGNPNSGETDWIKIRQNVANKSRGTLGLSVFGFGSDANMRELDALAGVTAGRSTFVTDPEDVRINLQDDLNRREHLVALNIQMKIEIDPDITILHLYGHDLITDPASREAVLRQAEASKRKARDETGVESQPDIITDEKGIRIFAPDLAVGETYWVVFELEIPAERNLPDLGKALIQYVDALAGQNAKHEFALSLTGSIPANAVTVHGIGLWTSEVTFYALDDLYQNDYDTAKARITKHIEILEAAKRFAPTPQFTDDIISLRKFVSLAGNLGKPISYGEDMRGVGNYTIFALNSFGRVRNGFMRTNY